MNELLLKINFQGLVEAKSTNDKVLKQKLTRSKLFFIIDDQKNEYIPFDDCENSGKQKVMSIHRV